MPRCFNVAAASQPRKVFAISPQTAFGRSFNVAAASQPRKVCADVAAASFMAGFNVAAASQPRKAAWETRPTRSICGFNVAAASQPRKAFVALRGIDLVGGASMWPRLRSRGKICVLALAHSGSGLQCGRGFAAAERPLPRLP
jgi:hypothetical protein